MWLLLCQEKFKRFYESLKIIFKTKIKNLRVQKMGLKNDFKGTIYGIMGETETKYSYCE